MSHPAKINAAIRECLDTLRPGQLAIAHLAAYVRQLRNDPGWTDYEVNDVESSVRRILASMLDQLGD